ncbi:DUF6069 family protein [Streptomyces sp. NBC_00140]|uniref:DUF6069 family protein n=1 Tax=Streptomyces sp. NBC_00140 TaxID=2975664 RepID=UPI0022555E75|nr:DUF6069 family protein [Streptomyces sp. NBC_00140]MCX5329011.1 DUF6069 family protein [Streptomyces sp. NBC_00140]
MRTLTLRGGARVAVVAAQWYDAFGVVTSGRVQLELRDGEPGPVLGRDAGFWLRGTGVRALRNPGRRTARVRVVTPGPEPSHASQHPRTPATEGWRSGMNCMDDTQVVAGPAAGPTSHTHRTARLAGTGSLATLAAMAATTLGAALAQAVGVDFEVPDGGERIPLSGFAVVTGFFSVVGIVIAAALLRWSAHPAKRFVWTAVSLTALSWVPPLLSGADAATITALIGLHLVPATVMIPALARSLRTLHR